MEYSISPDSKKRIDSLTDNELEYEVCRGEKSRFRRDKFLYLKDHYKQRKRAKADSVLKSYFKMIKYLLQNNNHYRAALLLLTGWAASSWYGIWNLDYSNILDSGLINIQTKKQIIRMAPNIIASIFLTAVLILNKYFMRKYKDLSKLSDEELDKLIKYL
jgi:hypothetical protein